MASLNEISDGYREAAILIRMRLDEIRAQIPEAQGAYRKRLEAKAVSLNGVLQQMRDLRQLTKEYYTRSRDGTYTCSQLRASRLDGSKT